MSSEETTMGWMVCADEEGPSNGLGFWKPMGMNAYGARAADAAMPSMLEAVRTLGSQLADVVLREAVTQVVAPQNELNRWVDPLEPAKRMAKRFEVTHEEFWLLTVGLQQALDGYRAQMRKPDISTPAQQSCARMAERMEALLAKLEGRIPESGEYPSPQTTPSRRKQREKEESERATRRVDQPKARSPKAKGIEPRKPGAKKPTASRTKSTTTKRAKSTKR